MRAKKIMRRAIWTLLALATLIALFYAEEDWRGARDLRDARNEMAHAGISLDYAKTIPPPIPNKDNLGALPLFDLQPDPSDRSLFVTPALDKAFNRHVAWPKPLEIGGPLDEKLADLSSLNAGVSAIYASAFKNRVAPASPREQFEAVYPFVAQLRDEALVRTGCQFDIDLARQHGFSLLVDQVKVAKFLGIDGVLALESHETEVALADSRTILLLASGACAQPNLLGGLVSMAMRAINTTMIRNGLALHVWSDAELVELQNMLRAQDFLAEFPVCIKGEASLEELNIGVFRSGRGAPNATFEFPWGKIRIPRTILGATPSGWVDENEAQLLRFQLQLIETIDPARRRVDAASIRKLEKEAGSPDDWVMPWNLLFQPASDSLRGVPGQYTRAQVTIDHGIWACALERYRIARGHYPQSLDALVPNYCPALRHDPIDGAPYRYRVLPEGGYLLYSIGLNGRDDGGKIVYAKNNSYRPMVDDSQGDWVWFGPK